MAIKVELHGVLKEFGEKFELEAHSTAEAISAIEANCPGFRSFARDMHLSLVFIDNVPEEDMSEDHVQVIDEQSLNLPIGGGGTLHIVPVVEGDVETSFIIIASSLTPAIGTTAASIVAAVAIAAVITIAAIGIAKLLAPSPPSMDTENSKPSYYFNGAVNTLQQGNPCPILYGGPIIVGSQVVSMAVQTSDIKKLRSTAEATFVDVISEGEIEGFAEADLESSIYFDKVPVKSNGELNFDEGFDFELKTGTNTQDIASIGDGLYSSTAYQPIGVQVTYASGPVTRTSNVENTDRLEITLYVPSLLKLKDDGDTKKNDFTYRWSVQGVGAPSYVEIETREVEGKTSSGYYFTTGVNLDPAVHGTVPYNVKLERIDDDDNGVKKTSAFTWQAMTSIIRAKMRYPNSAYMITKLDAKQFNNTPTRGYKMLGVKVQIPNNYNPVTREYSGAWDGNFHGSRQWTDNPAWIFYDLATNDRYGLGQYLQPGMVDKWALYTIAQYCDELVDNGYGGTEPRFRCSMYLQTAGEALNVLRDLAGSFRSIMYWRYAYLVVDQDTPDTPVAQFTPANVVDGVFEYTGTSKHTRYTVALVSWLNPDNYYEAEVEYVEDPVGIALYGIKELSMTAVGCTSRGQANRTGKYALLTSRLETDAVSFSSGLEGMNVAPGNIVKIVDPLKNQSDEHVGGRVMGITTTSVTLDREVTLDFAETYTITLTGTDGVPVSRAVTNGAGTITPPTAITWSGSLSPTPDLNTVWTLTKDSESEILYKVTSVKEPEKGSESFYQLTCVRHDETKYAEADSPDPLQGPTLPSIPAPGSKPVENLTLDLGVVARPEGLVRFIDASWTPPLLDSNNQYFTGYFIIEIEGPGGSTETYQTYDTSYRLYNPDLGTYLFTVWAVSQFDQVKSPPAYASVTVDEITDLDLVKVSGLELAGQGNDPTFEGKDAEFEWRMTSAIEGDIGNEEFPGDTGTPPPWFKDFEVTILSQEGEVLRIEYVQLPSYIYSYEKNLADGGPRRYFTIEVRVRDIYNRETDEASLFVYNPAPVGFNSIDFATGIETLIVTITPPDDNDYERARCYVSQTQGFQPSQENLLYEGSDWTFTVSGLTEQIYYVRLEPVDAFGPSGNYTAEQQINLTTVSDIQNQLAHSITETELYDSLNERINLIDTGAAALIPRVGQNEADIAQLQSEFNVGISTYYQDTDPQLGVPTPADPVPTLVVGDLWVDTSSADTIKRWNGSGWDSLEASGNQVFYRDGPPYAPYDGPSPDPSTLSAGDYWIDTGVTVPAELNHPYIWTGLSWVSAREGLLASVAVDVTLLQATVDNPTTGVSANAIAIDAMQVEVFGDPQPGSNIYTQAQSIEGIELEVVAKARTFQQPNDPNLTTPLTVDDTGDIWIDTDDNNKMWRWDGSQWVDASDSSVSGNNTYFQATAPSIPPAVEGDLWFDTDDGNRPYIVEGGVWVDVTNTAGTGNRTFFTPTNPYPGLSPSTGDLWFDTDDGNSGWRWNGTSWDSILDENATGINTYVQTGAPTGALIGDIWYDSNDGNKVYRWNGVDWISVRDADIAQALSDAATAEAKADGKIETFYQNSAPVGVAIGDLWVDTDNGNFLSRWNGSSWDPIQDADIQLALTTAQSAESTADGKIVSFYQTTPPSAGSVGDIWFDTDDSQHPYRWDGVDWVSVRDTSVTGVTTFLSDTPPTANATGDLWFDTDDNNHPYRWDGNLWEDVRDGATGIQTFYTDTQPTATAIGDLWFDTSNDNKPYRWNGSTWDEVTDGTVLGVVAIYQDTPPGSANEGDIWIDTDDDNKPYIWQGGQWVDLTQQTNRITAAVAVEQYARITADLVGYAEYTVKVDVNGHIAGIGLSVEGGTSGPIRSEAIILADRFAVGFPTREFETNYNYQLDEWVTPSQAFVDANGTPDADGVPRWDYVYKVVADNGSSGGTEATWPSSPGSLVWQGNVRFETFNIGATLPFIVGQYNYGTDESPDYRTGVVIDQAMIAEASIDNAKIKNATITDAKIYDLSAGKITAGTIDVTGNLYLGDTNFLLNSQYRKMEVWDDQTTPVRRVRIGSLVDGAAPDEWGIEIRDANNNIMLSTDSGISNDALTGLGAFAFEDQITSGNISTYVGSQAIGRTYIANLAVDTAQIADAAIESAKIANLAVQTAKIANANITTLKVAGQAITIPVSDYANDQSWNGNTSCEVAINTGPSGESMAAIYINFFCRLDSSGNEIPEGSLQRKTGVFGSYYQISRSYGWATAGGGTKYSGIAISYVLNNPSANTTYYFRIVGSGSGWRMKDASLIAFGSKR